MTTTRYSTRKWLKEIFIVYDLNKSEMARSSNKKGMRSTGFWQHDQDLPHSCHRALFYTWTSMSKGFFHTQPFVSHICTRWRSSGNIPEDLITQACLDKQLHHMDDSFQFQMWSAIEEPHDITLGYFNILSKKRINYQFGGSFK